MNKRKVMNALSIGCICATIVVFLLCIGFAIKDGYRNSNQFCVQDNPKKVSYGRMGVSGGLFGDRIITHSLGYSGINSKTQKECVSWHLVIEGEYIRRMYKKYRTLVDAWLKQTELGPDDIERWFDMVHKDRTLEENKRKKLAERHGKDE